MRFLKDHLIAVIFCIICIVLGYSIESVKGDVSIINKQALVNAEGRLGTLELFMSSVCEDNGQYYCDVPTD